MKKPFVPPDEPTALNKVASGTMRQGRKAGAESEEDASSDIRKSD